MANHLLDDSISKQVREIFQQIDQPVEVLFFGQKEDCQYCGETRQLVEEVTALSDQLSVKTYDLDADITLAQQYGVDKAPMLVMLAKNGAESVDYGIRYSGIPSGHEFSSLIHDLIRISKRDSGLSQQTRDLLKDVKEPVHMMVFVTPTCPYCPQAVLLAHQMAQESPYVTAEMVEATEFPELSNRYNVSGVPQTTINFGAGTVVGAVPETHLIAEIQRALGNKGKLN